MNDFEAELDTTRPARHPVDRAGPELAIVIPTFREVDNIEPLLALLERALAGIAYEVVFVDDDSPDATATKIRQIGRADPRVRCVLRIGRRGLSSAVVEGVLAANADFIAVMDADLQHDETLLPKMLAAVKSQRADVVIASRYVDGGGIGQWSGSRAWMSRLATRLSGLVLRQPVRDPMSGFFMTRQALFEQAVPHLSREGYKILLDFLASSPRALRCLEVPYVFRARVHGQSKLDSLVLWEYAMLLLDKMTGGRIPARFVMFSLVGGSGVLVHFLALTLLLGAAALGFTAAQAAATLVAMTWNYALNNWLTYRDRRLRGAKWLSGLLSFYLVCGVGALANVGIAHVLFERDYRWWAASGAGVLVGTVFNYVTTALFTWKGR